MRYRIETSLNDGLAEAPGVTVECESLEDLFTTAGECYSNDYGVPFGVGSTLTIERLPDEGVT
jgi:diadenosine tetraphosphatase ApaH/serine/threonine PP2A family protein phosphatase